MSSLEHISQKYTATVHLEPPGWCYRMSEAKSPYIVSDDLADVADILSYSPNHPSHVSGQTLDNVRSILSLGLNTALSNPIEYVSVPDMSEELVKRTEALRTQYGADVVISLDSHYLPPDREKGIFQLQMTRLYDAKTGLKIGRGARPHFLPIEMQVADIVKASKGSGAVIVESGVVTGGTIETIINLLAKQGVETKCVQMGMGMTDAIKQLQQRHPQLKIDALIAMDKVVDWTEARDFLAFVPDSGQTAGAKSKKFPERYLPKFSYCSATTIPYPLGRINRWATLSDEGTAIMRVAGLKASRELYQGIEDANGNTPFTFDDLLTAGARISHRVKVGLPRMLAGYEKYSEGITPGDRIIDVLDHILSNTHTLADETEILLPESVESYTVYPGGNETALVTTPVDRVAYPEVARRLLMSSPETEQVGFVENLGEQEKLPRLCMAGGEFCGNAARSMTKWLHDNPSTRRPDGHYQINVSGTDHVLNAWVDGQGDVTLEIPIARAEGLVREVDDHTSIVSLDGITHVVSLRNGDGSSVDTQSANCLLRQLGFGESSHQAVGTIYASDHDGVMSIDPFVGFQKGGDSWGIYPETSCASGTAALGLAIAARTHKELPSLAVMQPSGIPLNVEVREGNNEYKILIKGPVQITRRDDIPLF
jgi:histidine racemase